MIKVYINLHLFCLHKMSLSCVNHLSFMGFRVSNIVRITDVSKRVFTPAISFNKTVAFVQNFNLMSYKANTAFQIIIIIIIHIH